ncbi:O-antigen ligase [Paenarthrobacter nicotinovorans]|uniref:O-antigen ligase family protein n=1 Tax=Paenarthrobacter nicotinovorans TaxID=29320 RepID=UPI0027890B71|nr:O-antigen ligase family protein [Paenarthrobacter nicotinovorans]MDP9936315.1 O-antigen ligase [Paenarthrobacter nicotinovorans]
MSPSVRCMTCTYTKQNDGKNLMVVRLGTVKDRETARLQIFLLVALVLGVLQLYVLPFLPLAIWWILLASPFTVLRRGAVKFPWLALSILAIVFVQLASVAWSPDPLQGLRSAGTAACFVIVFYAAFRLLLSNELAILRVMNIAGAFVAGHAILITVFFLSPRIESLYLKSKLAPYLSGQGVTRIFGDMFNNVILDGKAGGLFVNGNTASMFMGVCAAVFLATGIKFRSRWSFCVAMLAYAGAFMTGSKTALFIGLAWIGACGLVYALSRRSPLVLPGIVAAILAVQVGLAYVLEKSPELLADSSHTFGSRQRMWDVAFRGLAESPILGLGFGGWFDQYRRFGSEIGFSVRPAHNLLLQAWLDSGVLGALTTLIFFGTILFGCLRVMQRADATSARIACSVLAASGWVFIHGQGDNTLFYGDTHSLVFLAVGLAFVSKIVSSNDGGHGNVGGFLAIATPRPARTRFRSTSHFTR